MINEFKMSQTADQILRIMEDKEFTVEEAERMPMMLEEKLKANEKAAPFKANIKTANR